MFPNPLTFGVVSDIHIGYKPETSSFLENALRWLAAQNVDAVLCPGDLSHSGLISEIEEFATIWNRVFPSGCGPDGRKVELMLVTGNHDVDAWGGRWDGFSENELAEKRFWYGDNPEKTWLRLFGQKWETVWRREVKGFNFLGAQWQTINPPVEAFLTEVCPKLDPSKPFFYCQHSHPKNTCHGDYSDGDDGGEAVRALASFPNAVAISGHSHCAISDERAVWQETFTSIGAGCTFSPRLFIERPEYVNASVDWHSSWRNKTMARLSNTIAGMDIGGCYEMVTVFSDHLVIHRRSAVLDEPIGPPWMVPLPARADGPLNFARRAAEGTPPQFPADAEVEVAFFPHGHEQEGPGHRGEPCIAVTFPYAEPVGGHRVFDYEIRAEAEGTKPVIRRIMAPGFAYPESYAHLPGTCLLSPGELPQAREIRFTTIPRDCFGNKGRGIVKVWKSVHQ